MISVDSDGANGHRVRAWKKELADFTYAAGRSPAMNEWHGTWTYGIRPEPPGPEPPCPPTEFGRLSAGTTHPHGCTMPA